MRSVTVVNDLAVSHHNHIFKAVEHLRRRLNILTTPDRAYNLIRRHGNYRCQRSLRYLQQGHHSGEANLVGDELQRLDDVMSVEASRPLEIASM